MEGIDDQPFRGIVGVQILHAAHQEVAGEVDAFGANAGAARHLDVNQRHRDRNPLLPIHHFIQAAVARVVELLAVAGKPELAEQVTIHRVDARGQGRVVARILRDEVERRIAHLLETVEIWPVVEARILDARDQERRPGEVGTGSIGGIGDLIGERLDDVAVSLHRAHPTRRV